MDKNSKIFLTIFFLIIIVITTISFVKYFVLKDYYVQAQADCDPALEVCYAFQCDPVADDTCSTDPAEQTSYYKIIEKKASEIPLCDPNFADCPALTCAPDEDCQEIFCSDETVGEGEVCTSPETYFSGANNNY